MREKIDRVEPTFIPQNIPGTDPEDLRSDADATVLHSPLTKGQPFEDVPGLYDDARGGLPVGREVRVVAKSKPVLVGSGEVNDGKNKRS